MSINPFDEIAVEEAVCLKEKGLATEVIAVTIGVAKCDETLRTAMAMGADSGIHVITENEIQPLAVAKILQKIIKQQSPNLVIMGKQAIDDDSNQTGQMLAGLLNWPQGTFASKLNIVNGRAEVTREVDGGLITISLKLPAIVTADLRLNKPRYPALPNIMKARSKPVNKTTPEELEVDISPRLKTLKVEAPRLRSGGIKVASVDELIDKLKNEAKVIS